jgi:hemolysin activation/secretion protein
LRRSRQLSLGYSGRFESDAAYWSYTTELATNLPGGEGNNLAAYQSEDPRITSARWAALRANGSYTTGFAGNWLLNVRGGLQHSPKALIAGEQYGLGGMTSVRGTSERPISGDSGASVTMEVSAPEIITGMRALGFVDSGWVSNQNPNGGNKPGNDQLRSVGLGLRYGTPRLAVSADYGRVVTGSSVPLSVNSTSPQKGDHKLHVNLIARF